MTEFASWRDYWQFSAEIIRRQRYIFSPATQKFLEAVTATCETRARLLRMDAYLWRAQIGCCEKEDENGSTVLSPYSGERMKPLKDSASEGRVNAKGIPCLYTATDPTTAISEVRPQIGTSITVASLFPVKQLQLVDCGSEGKTNSVFLDEPETGDREKAVWEHINKAFSRPVTRSEDRGEYAPTQILAELFKTLGYDGVAYQSGYGESGYNIALFDPANAIVGSCWVYRVDDMKHKTSVISDAGVREVNAPAPGNELLKSLLSVVQKRLEGNPPI